MSLSIDPKEFAKVTVMANPSTKEDPEEKAKECLELYLNAYKLAEKYERFSTAHDSQETTEIYRNFKEEECKI